MASTLRTTKTSTTSVVPPRANIGETWAWETYTVAAALVVNDVIQMVKIPAGATILDVVLSASDLDTGTSAAIVLDVGDDGDTDRFIDGSTAGQAGGVTHLNNRAGHCYTYTADNTIDVLVQVAPATGATSGTIALGVCYTMEQ
jgi:hypothetical protein